MRDFITVMKFSIKEMITKKSFIISTIIILALIVLAFNVPNILNKFSDGEDFGTEKMLIIDSDNIFEGNLKALEASDEWYKFEVKNENYSDEQIKEKIENEEIDSCIKITKNKNNINLEYTVESLNTFVGMAEIPEDVIQMLTEAYKNMQIMKLNLSEEELTSINPQFEFSFKETNENSASGQIGLVMILSIILFYAIFFCANKVATSVTTEKTSKIMETLVTSTSPSTIIMGKTIGIGIVGLIQLILIIVTGIVSANLFIDKEVLNNLIDLSNVNIGLGLITLLYFLIGYFIFAFIFALTGSAIARPEDVQSASAPASILAVFGFYIAYFAMMNPASEMNTFANILPLSAPFSVPFSMLLGTAKFSVIAISILVSVITIALIAKISIKVYSSAILNYGSKMSVKDIFNLIKRKENN